MKILCFADVHSHKESLSQLVQKARDADVLVCAGDLSIFGQGLEKSTQMLTRTGKMMLMVPGNHESEEEVKELSRRFQQVIPLHKHIYTIGDYVFVGYGEGGFSFRDPGMESFFHKVRAHLSSHKKIIFVTHAPPYRTTLDYLPWLREHRGCKTTAEIIKHMKPTLTVCGHFHETSGKSCMMGKTLVVNPGPRGKIVHV